MAQAEYEENQEFEEDQFEEDPLEPDCPYGFEFCEDPQTRDLNLCTTECSLYMQSVKDAEK